MGGGATTRVDALSWPPKLYEVRTSVVYLTSRDQSYATMYVHTALLLQYNVEAIDLQEDFPACRARPLRWWWWIGFLRGR